MDFLALGRLGRPRRAIRAELAEEAATPPAQPAEALAARDRRLVLEKDLLQLDFGGRVALAKLIVGVFVGAGALASLWFTSRNLRAANRNAEIANRALQINQRGQVTDRFTKAIDQLGRTVYRGGERKAEPHLEVRLGGLYALERIALDSRGSEDNYLRVVVDVLAAYVRENIPKAAPSAAKPPSAEGEKQARGARPRPRVDIQTALAILGRLPQKEAVNLANADLRGADLRRAVLYKADLSGAILESADLSGAKLDDAVGLT